MNDSAVSPAIYTIGSSGASWYNTSWTTRQPITLLHGRVSGSGSLAYFPALISMAVTAAQANGNDILFTDSSGVKLPHEIESYASGQLTAWVQVPSVSAVSDTTIYIYYGNASAPSQQNAIGVWDT